jgi:hypothetical protein
MNNDPNRSESKETERKPMHKRETDAERVRATPVSKKVLLCRDFDPTKLDNLTFTKEENEAAVKSVLESEKLPYPMYWPED